MVVIMVPGGTRPAIVVVVMDTVVGVSARVRVFHLFRAQHHAFELLLAYFDDPIKSRLCATRTGRLRHISIPPWENYEGETTTKKKPC
jgi:hypothetical protein